MILVLEDKYESPLSIDTKNSTNSPLFNVTMTSESRKTEFLRILDENRQNFTFSPKILGICNFGGVCLIVKGNDYYNMHRKFQVHSTNIFVLGAKTNIARWQPPPTPNFDSLPYPYPRVG